jgi:hypothetical protein
MNLRDALRAGWTAQEQDLEDRQTFQKDVCQCCGHLKKSEADPECVCDGLDWYLDKFGNVECQAHRFARAIGQGKKSFALPFWRKK